MCAEIMAAAAIAAAITTATNKQNKTKKLRAAVQTIELRLIHIIRIKPSLFFVSSSPNFEPIPKRNYLQKFCHYVTIPYTIFAIMRSLYMRSHFDHLF